MKICMDDLKEKLFPICRSLSGQGVRETLDIIKDNIDDIRIIETPSNTKAFDWNVPNEWCIKDAWIKNSKGEKIISFKDSNLHVVSYSTNIHKKITFKELKNNLHFIKELPDAIPYRTSYYEENWGFCLSHNQYLSLDPNEVYEVFIDSKIFPGHITHGEVLIPGILTNEILISTYICHPSMGNDNLSGILAAVELYKHLKMRSNLYSYRILFLPETIGAINWLSQNQSKTSKIVAGFVITCVGDSSKINLKKSRQKNSTVNKAALYLQSKNNNFNIIDYFPMGSDERQYCSPGFDLPVATIMRSIPGRFPEYHTSLDNLNFISTKNIKNTVYFLLKLTCLIEKNLKFKNLIMFCEPQLGKRGLYRAVGGQKFNSKEHEAIKWVLNYSDGKNDLIDISIKSNINIDVLSKVANVLVLKSLLERCN